MFAVGMLSDVDESLRVLEPIPPNVIAWAGVLVFAIGWYNFHKNQKTIAKAYKDRDILAKIIDSRQKKD